MTVTADTITTDQIWEVAADTVRRRDTRLLGYCDAALRGGVRRDAAGRKHCAVAWNRLHGVDNVTGQHDLRTRRNP